MYSVYSSSSSHEMTAAAAEGQEEDEENGGSACVRVGERQSEARTEVTAAAAGLLQQSTVLREQKQLFAVGG